MNENNTIEQYCTIRFIYHTIAMYTDEFLRRDDLKQNRTPIKIWRMRSWKRRTEYGRSKTRKAGDKNEKSERFFLKI